MMERRGVDRIRRRFRCRHQVVPPLDALEMRVEPLRRGQPSARRFVEAEGVVQEAARAGRIHHEPRGDADRSAVAISFECRAIAFLANTLEACPVEIYRPFGLGLTDERVIEVGPVPMRIRNVVVGTRRNQELPLMIVVVRKRFA